MAKNSDKFKYNKNCLAIFLYTASAGTFDENIRN